MDANSNRRVYLPDEEAEIFSSILEFMYKGDYYPRLVHNKKRNSWEIEQPDGGRNALEATIYHHATDGDILKDTVIYCAAEKFGLEELKKVALRKQGLRKCPMRGSIFYGLHFLYSSPLRANHSTIQSLVSSAAPSWHPLAMPTPTLPIRTRNSGPITSLSSSAVAAPSSEVGPCSWRCSTADLNSSLTSLWL